MIILYAMENILLVNQDIMDMVKVLCPLQTGQFIRLDSPIYNTISSTILLNVLCARGLSMVSWIIVFIPFLLMSIISAILLLVLGLDPYSGNLVTEKDIKKGICSHYDFLNKIRFYSTFHINEENFEVYWNSLKKIQPEFIVGFPSSLMEICKIADSRNLRLENKVKVFFTTSETVLSEHRDTIGKVLGCRLVDQYASSEGAPFISECEAGRMHIHPLSGIFEIVDDNMQPSKEGEILVTSFTTRGTPLIRYRIGDRIKLSSNNTACSCGSIFPLIDKIEGRAKDFIYSPEKGRINLVNIGNSAKGLKGIVCFQVVQNIESEITIKIVVTDAFNMNQEENFISAIRDRIGSNMNINIEYADDIPREKGGKFSIVKNNLQLS